ncbi:MAG: hypothetical protein OHK0038_27470 [Flammeovirgaceae bacterium]
MNVKKTRTDLIFDSLKSSIQNGATQELSERNLSPKLNFTNLNLDSLRIKKQQVEYASVKLRTDLYNRLKNLAESQGIKQPGKLISMIVESFLNEVELEKRVR